MSGKLGGLLSFFSSDRKLYKTAAEQIRGCLKFYLHAASIKIETKKKAPPPELFINSRVAGAGPGPGYLLKRVAGALPGSARFIVMMISLH